MCIGGGKSSQPQAQNIPAPAPPTTFNYNPPKTDQQRAADATVSQTQSATMLSSTTGGGAFGSELGTSGSMPNNGGQ